MRSQLLVKGHVVAAFILLALPGTLRAQSDDVNDYVVFAEQLVKLGSVNLIASGNVGVNNVGGTLVAKGRLASGDGTHIVADMAYVGTQASLYSLYANQAFLHAGVVVRSAGEPAAWPAPVLASFPVPVSVSYGGPDVKVTRRVTVTLPPGSYGRIKVLSKGTLILTGGTYDFDSILTASTARLLFGAPTTVNIANRLTIGSLSVVAPIDSTLPEDVQINVGGDKVKIKSQVTIVGKIRAPLATLKVGLSCLIKGHLLAHEIRIGSGTVLQEGNPLRPFGLRTPTPTPTSTEGAPASTPTGTATPTATSTHVPASATSTATTPTATRTPLHLAICGDGITEGGEQCDDGNTRSGDGCSSECRTEGPSLLGARLCTLTQGAWGAPNGIANGPSGFFTQHPEIVPATLGGPGQSTTLQTQDAVIGYLPKGETPSALFKGERVFATASDVVPDGGGVLAGQTLALTLAVHLSQAGGWFDGLESLVLPNSPFCTQALTAGPDGILGTADDQLDGSGEISGPWALPSGVATANNTINDLILMANQYLRGGKSVATSSDVNAALSTINEAFDECRQVVACP